MANLEIVLSLAGTALSLLLACATFIFKLVKNIRLRIREEGATALLNTVAPIVQTAEAFANYSGAEKKEYVLTKVNQYAIENGIDFDASAVSDKIEELVELSKRVNTRTDVTA